MKGIDNKVLQELREREIIVADGCGRELLGGEWTWFRT